MKTLRFNTTINCANCVRAITPTLNGEKAISSWQVDTENPNKVLTVSGDLSAEQVMALIVEAGFEARPA
ncbi:heavy-metal-associated domain-containing protein [Hymenobacter lapidiphilus]|uniref:Heavy-metal-associated domain-containing protein n=1 Tax=Hymenobacter lapidiphilus TaxID=2608003 RepID=A0A7Y7U406_9BACT|nr:heavy metal-associated domain-containing protein [Hymenobacter lapidiphilus]NVO29772.1 heavy-metal-associated domain-containing protein [Hymenobacter lapidiphilus]